MVAYVQEYTPLSGQPIPLWHHLSGEVWLRSHYRGCRSSKTPKLLAGQGVSRTSQYLKAKDANPFFKNNGFF